jgi:hypothetical protein
MKRIAIVQSNYIPWKGYFDLINLVDEFVLIDDFQYTKEDWRNRNLIKTQNGTQWLTIPVSYKNSLKPIRTIKVSDSHWAKKHWNKIVPSYVKAKHFRQYRDFFEELYLGLDETYLSKINYRFITAICDLLSIKTKISWSMDYRLEGGKTERLVNLCKQLHATEYLSGPAAKSYLDVSAFESENIRVSWMSYQGYPEYDQLYTPPFIHEVSIIDLIFNIGSLEAPCYMLSFDEENQRNE